MSFSMSTKTHHPFYLIVLFLSIASTSVFAETSHRILLEGLHDAEIGYEIDINKILAKFLFAGGALGDGYVNVRFDLHAGKKWVYAPGIEYAGTIGCHFEYSRIDYSKTVYETAVTAIPSLNIMLYKYFGRVFIGGNAALNVWKFQKNMRNDQNSRWHGSRLLDIEPEFIIGFCFL
jgi:hypothetical protein